VIRHVDLQHGIDVVAFQEELSLMAIAWKAIEDEAKVPIVQLKPFFDNFLDNIVGHKFAVGHEPADTRGQLRVALDMPAKNIAYADVRQIKLGSEQLRLGAFAAALDAHDDIFMHGSSIKLDEGQVMLTGN